MSTTCHFCTSSGPFYKKLLAEMRSRRGERFEAIAVLPESQLDALSYADSLGVRFDTVLQGQVSGVVATPTLLLVNANGTIVRTWVGQLPNDREVQVAEEVSKAKGA